MKRFFQTFGFRDSPYHRPFQKWTCGRAAEGRPCLLGPGRRGECRIRFECRPVRNGDRWVCTRPEGAGGRCDSGPTPEGACGRNPIPCAPVRGLRSRRAQVGRWMAAVTVGLLLILFGGTPGYEAVSQGGLAAPHAEFGRQCASCHTAGRRSPLEWVTMAFQEPVRHQDSELCLSCHQMGAASLFPHHRAPDTLARLGAAQEAAPAAVEPLVLKLGDRMFDPDYTFGQAVPCATCHREHQGAAADLTRMDDVRCQSCHVRQFAGLARGHPEFTDFPYDRRTRLVFDHASHIGRHFFDPRLAEQAPKECSNCHGPDILGDGMLVREFETVCGDCHGESIVSRNLALLQVPGLDVYSLEDLDVDIGYWPEFADAPVSPFIELLLSDDADYVAARETLAGFDLLDLFDATDEEAAAAATIAWSIKGLLADVISEGTPYLRRRLAAAAGRPITDAEAAVLFGTIPVDTFRAIEDRWFPSLRAEVAAYRDGDVLPELFEPPLPEPPEGAPEPVPDDEWAENGGWFIDYFSMVYRPLGHADPVIAGWLDFAADIAHADAAAANGVLDSLAEDTGPGTCAKCHAVDAAGDAYRVNWQAKLLDPQEHRFNDFSHVSHFNLSGITGCTNCHVLDVEAAYAASFDDRDPATFRSNFLPIERQVCAECHVPESAGGDCTTCHNYHVGTFPPAVIGGPLMVETDAGGETPAEPEPASP